VRYDRNVNSRGATCDQRWYIFKTWILSETLIRGHRLIFLVWFGYSDLPATTILRHRSINLVVTSSLP
jgi:hypothetical protein